jgi:hypothetical protein
MARLLFLLELLVDRLGIPWVDVRYLTTVLD